MVESWSPFFPMVVNTQLFDGEFSTFPGRFAGNHGVLHERQTSPWKVTLNQSNDRLVQWYSHYVNGDFSCISPSYNNLSAHSHPNDLTYPIQLSRNYIIQFNFPWSSPFFSHLFHGEFSNVPWTASFFHRLRSPSKPCTRPKKPLKGRTSAMGTSSRTVYNCHMESFSEV